MAWRLADGVIQCRFRRQVLVPQDPTRFSLDAQYYLFMAYGEAENGELQYDIQSWYGFVPVQYGYQQYDFCILPFVDQF